MLSSPIPPEEERIALIKTFKAIAEYGRKVRLRRQAEAQNSIEQESNSRDHLSHPNNIHVENEELASE